MGRFERIEGFPAEIADALVDVYRQMPVEDRTLFNDPYFQQRCAEGAGDSSRPFVLVYRQGDEVLGAAAFRYEDVRLAGLCPLCIVPVTYRLAEFTAFVVRADVKATFLAELVGELRSMRHYVLLPNLREADVSELPAGGAGMMAYGEVANPICLDEDGRFKSLIGKKRNRYYTNRLKRMGELTVTHALGGVADEAFERFVAFHRERWACEGIASKFENPEMVALYRGLCCGPVAAAKDGSGVVFSEVRLDDVTVAMSVSYRWGQRLVYHVPTMNLEFMDYSPGQVLLREMFIYAADQHLTCLDLGYGDESYKERFYSDTLTYRTYVIAPSSWKAASLRLRKAVARRLRRVKTDARPSPAEMSDVALFTAAAPAAEAPEKPVLMDFAAYVRYTRQHDDPPIPLRREIYPYFRGGGKLAAVMTDGRITACVWLQDEKSDDDASNEDAPAAVYVHSPQGRELPRLIESVQVAHEGRTVIAVAAATDTAAIEAFVAAGMTESSRVCGDAARKYHQILSGLTVERP